MRRCCAWVAICPTVGVLLRASSIKAGTLPASRIPSFGEKIHHGAANKCGICVSQMEEIVETEKIREDAEVADVMGPMLTVIRTL